MFRNLSLNSKANRTNSKPPVMEPPKKIRTITYISKRVQINNNDTTGESSKENNEVNISKDELVLGWNIKFGNSENLDVQKFIESISVKKRNTNLSDDDLLKMAPLLLTDHPLKWYKLHANRFFTWQDFVVELTFAYKDPRHLPSLHKKSGQNKKFKKSSPPKITQRVCREFPARMRDRI